MARYLVAIIFCICAMIDFTNGQFSNMTRQQMMKYLTNTSRYNSDIIPDYNKEEAAIVRIQLTIHDIHTISETSMDFSVDLILRQVWRDERLDFSTYNTTYTKLEVDPTNIGTVWHPDTYLCTHFTHDFSVDIFLRQVWRDERLDFSTYNTSYTKLEVDPTNIGTLWHPDTYFRNERRAQVHAVTKRNELMHIGKNGTIVYSMRLSMTLTCAMLLHKYPFDKQTCPIFIQSFGYTVDNIDLMWRENQPLSVRTVELPHFSLSQDVTTSRFILDHQTGSFSCLKAEIHLGRKAAYYFIHVFMPSVLLVVLSWVSFWVDPAAVPARVTLGVTCVLTLTTQSSGIRQSLPPVSYIKAIDVWMFVCLLFVFAALLEFAYINVIQRRSKSGGNDSEDQRRSKNGGKDSEDQEENSKHTKEGNATWISCCKEQRRTSAHDRAKRVDIISRFAFPAVFAIFLVMFILVCGFAPDPVANTYVSGA